MNGNRITPNHIEELKPNEILVFGSNLNGFHSGGAARIANEKWGAIWGQGVGLQGKTYAIPTMQGGTETIKPYVDEFIQFAKDNPNKIFLVTAIGCGIAGFQPKEIAPLFIDATNVENIRLPEIFWNENELYLTALIQKGIDTQSGFDIGTYYKLRFISNGMSNINCYGGKELNRKSNGNIMTRLQTVYRFIIERIKMRRKYLKNDKIR